MSPGSRNGVNLFIVLLAIAIFRLCEGVVAMYPPTDAGRCQVGLTFTGLPDSFGGDYLWGGPDGYYRDGPGRTYLSYTYSDPHCNHTAYGCAGYGCDFYGCSASDAKMAKGKWAIISGDMSAKVVATCEEGCPDWITDCKDLYNVQDPSAPALRCPHRDFDPIPS